MVRAQIVGAQTEPAGRAGGEILDEDVCASDQGSDGVASGFAAAFGASLG